jgi:hypothetical protein
VIDGTRTRDNRNHNPGLYQLSYDHHLKRRAAGLLHVPTFGKAKIKHSAEILASTWIFRHVAPVRAPRAPVKSMAQQTFTCPESALRNRAYHHHTGKLFRICPHYSKSPPYGKFSQFCGKCREQDSNLHTLRYQNLNLARLPIPPSRHAGGPYRAGSRGQELIAGWNQESGKKSLFAFKGLADGQVGRHRQWGGLGPR